MVLVDLQWLKPHEEVRVEKVDELAEVTKKWGCYTKPLLVDRTTGAILDGHHRYHVGIVLGLKRLPVVLFDYLADEAITVEPWPNSGIASLGKEEIIEMSLSEFLYPAKTSRHTTGWKTPPIHIPLEQLSRAE